MNRRGKRLLALIVASIMTVSVSQPTLANKMNENSYSNNENDLRLWYTKSSSTAREGLNANQIWEEYTLPIGNGNIGGNVYGDVETEHITFNEKTLWTGGPSSKRPNYNGGNKEYASNGRPMYEVLKEIQDLFSLHTPEADKKASQLCNQLVGISDGYGAYQAWGDIYFDFEGVDSSNVENYVRDLDLRTAISSVNFTEGNTEYSREFFVSNPDNVMVIKLSAKGDEKLNFDVRFPSKQGANPIISEDTITLKGEVADNQLKFNSSLKVVSSNGEVIEGLDKLTVADAEFAYIYVSAATDYDDKYPVYRTGESSEELHQRVEKVVNDAVDKGYDKVKEDHLIDYKNIFDRVSLDIGQLPSSVPTDELLTEYSKQDSKLPEVEKRSLEVLLFQYGRYLTIASSREDSKLPSNLQGLWNNRNNPPWSSDYHMNVNLQMNYWPNYSTNMAETAIPLVNYIESLREPGRETARIYAGVESAKDPVTGEYIEANGFMAHTQNTPFGWTTPGWSFDWGWSPAAVPWILQNVWEMYEYTGDVEYMRNEIYPMMKEEVNLYENMLIWDEQQQRMVSSPTYSPEHGPRTVGNTYEQTLIWQLYDDTITAAEILGTENPETIAKWKDTQSKLDPIQIGDDGQIKEWYEETTLGSIPSEGYGHRHISHLLGLFPGDYISVETPELLDAALVSLRNRTDVSTGWGMGQRINTWARTGEGNKAYSLIRNQLKRVGAGIAGGGGTYSNLWDAHPPFQIDGNFGATSGIAEMLMQSNMGYINFLPALPDAWANGSVRGLVARGNFEVSAEWTEGKANELTIKSKNGGECVAKYANLSLATVTDSKGNNVEFEVIDGDKISFETVKGEAYTVTQIPSSEVDLNAPTGLVAERIESESVNLEWNALEGENVTYNVYRQINRGNVISIEKNIEVTEYSDDSAKDILGNFNYMISAIVDGKESLLSEAVSVKDLRNMAGYIDDRDERITYEGAWGDWNEAVNHAGTIKFLENPTGTETATLTFVGTGIELMTCTNKDRGKLEISIDGVVQGEVDTYSPTTVRKKIIYSKNDLEYGKHTIEVRATNTKSEAATKTKVEIDALNVLDSTIQKPESVEVTSASGINRIAIPNSTLQMVANVIPSDVTNKEVTWSVSDVNIATIDENGLLTIKETNGTVAVTATANDNNSVSGTTDIKVVIPSINLQETIVEDGTMDNVKNPNITWEGNWSVWAGESDRHHGGTKTEATTGATITYKFNGTGIEVYSQKHANFSSFDISIDGEAKGNFSLEGSGSGDDQQLIAEFKDLENKEHTIVMTAVDRAGKKQVNLDYFKVLTPIEGTIVNKVALQAEIQEQTKKIEESYTTESWKNFKVAYYKAVEIMNNDEATESEVADTLLKLQEATNALVEQEVLAPVIPSEAKIEGIAIETNTLMLTWPVINKASKYEVYNVTSGKEILVGETTNAYYRVSALEAGTTCKFVVRAINEAGKSSDFEVYTVKTLEDKDVERPSNIEGINVDSTTENSANITWNEATDNKGVVGYKVYLNGVLQGETTNLEYEFNNLTTGKEYTVKIIAVDEAGNTSLIPATIKFTPQREETEIVVSKVQNLNAIEKTSNSVTLSWDEPASLVGLVEYVIYKDGKLFTTIDSGITKYEVSELRRNTIYGFKVTAKYKNGEESKPISINIRTSK